MSARGRAPPPTRACKCRAAVKAQNPIQRINFRRSRRVTHATDSNTSNRRNTQTHTGFVDLCAPSACAQSQTRGELKAAGRQQVARTRAARAAVAVATKMLSQTMKKMASSHTWRRRRRDYGHESSAANVHKMKGGQPPCAAGGARSRREATARWSLPAPPSNAAHVGECIQVLVGREHTARVGGIATQGAGKYAEATRAGADKLVVKKATAQWACSFQWGADTRIPAPQHEE